MKLRLPSLAAWFWIEVVGSAALLAVWLIAPEWENCPSYIIAFGGYMSIAVSTSVIAFYRLPWRSLRCLFSHDDYHRQRAKDVWCLKCDRYF